MKNLYFPNTSSLEESIWIIIHKKYYFYLNIKKINTCNKIFQNIYLKIHNYPRVMILKNFPNINIPIPSIKWSQKKALQLYVACDTIHSYSFEVNTKGVYRNEKYEGYLTFDSGSLSFFLLFFPPPERTRTLSRPFEIGWFTRVLGDEPDCHIWFASGTYCNTGGASITVVTFLGGVTNFQTIRRYIHSNRKNGGFYGPMKVCQSSSIFLRFVSCFKYIRLL